MQVPSTRYFTAGEIETGAYLNASVTNLGNFMLGRPIASLTTSTTGTAIATTGTAITFTTSIINRDNAWSSSTNPTRYTAATAGWYFVTGYVCTTNNAAVQYRNVWFRTNGTTPVSTSLNTLLTTAGQTNNLVQQTTGFVYLNGSTDYIELMAASSTATTLAAPTGNAAHGISVSASMSLIWVSL